MEIIKFNNFSFTYEGYTHKALNSINLTINKGEFVTLFGKSGCGKSTLLRQLKPGIAPAGSSFGELLYKNEGIHNLSEIDKVTKIGFVFQNPDNGIVTDKVWHELAFGLENLGMSNTETNIKVAEIASYFGIDNWFHKSVNEISGGQKQLLNLAAAMVMQPEVLVLDEPTAYLDPLTAQEFLSILSRINKELGVTVIISEHRLEDVFAYSDKVVAMNSGEILDICAPDCISQAIIESNLWHSLPTPVKVASSVNYTENFPVSIRDGRRWLEQYKKNNKINELVIEDTERTVKSAVSVKNLWFSYAEDAVIKGCSLDVKENEIYAVLGGNGSGKTTLLSLLCGINKADRGKIIVADNKKVVMLPQNPQSLFVKNNVLDELCDISDEKSVIHMAELCGIKNILHRHPYDLSGGEQQKTALAKVLLAKPDVLLLDEPTKGLDADFKEDFANILKKLKCNGITTIIVSHDIEFCAEYADRCALFFDGKIATESSSKDFFNGKSFYTTSSNRMSREIVDNAVTCKDLIYACNGKVKQTPPDISDSIDMSITNNEIKPATKKISPKRSVFSLGVLAIMIVTVLIGMYFMDGRNFYAVSCLLMLEAFLPFVIMFEKRKPKARELVILSVLCALAVAGRAAFYMLPQFKPMIAIVIVSGVCFGAETGFLVGSVSMFVSNFFMGQGPWTPWQMFALGIVGFFAGVLFNKFLHKDKISLTVYGVLSSIFLYGLIMNSATVIMTTNTFNIKLLLAALISGFPFDLIHAFATAVFLWFASEPLITKFERVKKKYKIIN